jgi:hypothetical protein
MGEVNFSARCDPAGPKLSRRGRRGAPQKWWGWTWVCPLPQPGREIRRWMHHAWIWSHPEHACQWLDGWRVEAPGKGGADSKSRKGNWNRKDRRPARLFPGWLMAPLSIATFSSRNKGPVVQHTDLASLFMGRATPHISHIYKATEWLGDAAGRSIIRCTTATLLLSHAPIGRT